MINLLIKAGYPFATFRLPGEHEFVNIVQNDREELTFRLPELTDLRGFVMAPFDLAGGSPARFVRHDVSYTWLPGYEDAGAVALPDSLPSPAMPYEAGKEEYLERIKHIKKKIEAGKVRKVVLSRAKVIQLPAEFDFTGFFTHLASSYPDAFIFFVHIPGAGSWAGATPEILLHRTGRYYETAALAGTLPLDGEQSPPAWSEKEREEQHIVEEYIRQALEGAGFRPVEKEGPHTLIAGQMAHLETLFRVPLPKERDRVSRLLEALHPTPAVCGEPREEAFRIIREIEGYDRTYYTGFLGPWNTPYPTQLYVHLRSMHFVAGTRKAILYAGGGITAASDPQQEWEETVLKLRTMLSVLEKLPNFTG